MAQRIGLGSIIASASVRLYRGPVKAGARRAGVEPVLTHVYSRLLYRLTGDLYSDSVEGVSMDFKVGSAEEARMCLGVIKHERPVLSDLLGALEPDDVFWDVGANVGVYTCFVASRLSEGRAVAFEPHSGNAERLQENLGLNDLEADVRRVALSDSDGDVELTLGEEGAGTNHRLSNMSTDTETIPVEAVRGDHLVRNKQVSRPTVVKIDVEGAELRVIRGMEEALSNPDCRLVYCEVHKNLQDYSGSHEELSRVLMEAGLSTRTIHSFGDRLFVKAVRPS